MKRIHTLAISGFILAANSLFAAEFRPSVIASHKRSSGLSQCFPTIAADTLEIQVHTEEKCSVPRKNGTNPGSSTLVPGVAYRRCPNYHEADESEYR